MKLPLKVIALDFDGVVLETVGIKDWAFKTLFKDHPDHLDEIMAYHLGNNATIRFDKFKHITEKILKQKYTPELKESLSRQFTELTFQRIVECPFVKGAKEFLEYYYKKFPIYIATVNPADEFERILKARNIFQYITKIYTTPWLKKDALRDIMKQEKVSAENMVFVGDSVEDFIAAKDAGIFFIGRQGSKSFEDIDVPVLTDLEAVKNFLETSRLETGKQKVSK